MKKRGQLEYQLDDGSWWPEGSLFNWSKVRAVKQIRYLTPDEFEKWAKKMNKLLAFGPL